jgi:hypothetical protein
MQIQMEEPWTPPLIAFSALAACLAVGGAIFAAVDTVSDARYDKAFIVRVREAAAMIEGYRSSVIVPLKYYVAHPGPEHA